MISANTLSLTHFHYITYNISIISIYNNSQYIRPPFLLRFQKTINNLKLNSIINGPYTDYTKYRSSQGPQNDLGHRPNDLPCYFFKLLSDHQRNHIHSDTLCSQTSEETAPAKQIRALNQFGSTCPAITNDAKSALLHREKICIIICIMFQ